MLAAWLAMSTLLYSLQLNTGSFPKPLTEEEEQRYLTQAKAGDLHARNVLIERNLRLVAHIMKKYYTQSSDQEDLISIGTIGLIKGIETFDGSKGARLATYAARCVENAILTPMTLRVSTLHLKASNGLHGELWTGFRLTCMSFPRPRMTLCAMLLCSYIVLCCVHHGRFWRQLSSINSIITMRELIMFRTGCDGADIAKV